VAPGAHSPPVCALPPPCPVSPVPAYAGAATRAQRAGAPAAPCKPVSLQRLGRCADKCGLAGAPAAPLPSAACAAAQPRAPAAHPGSVCELCASCLLHAFGTVPFLKHHDSHVGICSVCSILPSPASYEGTPTDRGAPASLELAPQYISLEEHAMHALVPMGGSTSLSPSADAPALDAATGVQCTRHGAHSRTLLVRGSL
jgi:hypothetical protein